MIFIANNINALELFSLNIGSKLKGEFDTTKKAELIVRHLCDKLNFRKSTRLVVLVQCWILIHRKK